jgi:hypothetical protein
MRRAGSSLAGRTSPTAEQQQQEAALATGILTEELQKGEFLSDAFWRANKHYLTAGDGYLRIVELDGGGRHMDAEHGGGVVDVYMDRAVHRDELGRHSGAVRPFAGVEILHCQALQRTKFQGVIDRDTEFKVAEK